MTDEVKLLPCPFCGGKGRLMMPEYPLRADCSDAYVSCNECDVIGPAILIDNEHHDQDDWPALEAEAITAWNLRNPTSPDSERVAALVIELGYFKAGRVLSREDADEIARAAATLSQIEAIERERDAFETGLVQMHNELSTAEASVTALRERVEKLEAGLKRIAKWHGEFPATGRYWSDRDGKTPENEMSYAACFGSNGERDFMRRIANDALSEKSDG